METTHRLNEFSSHFGIIKPKTEVHTQSRNQNFFLSLVMGCWTAATQMMHLLHAPFCRPSSLTQLIKTGQAKMELGSVLNLRLTLSKKEAVGEHDVQDLYAG